MFYNSRRITKSSLKEINNKALSYDGKKTIDDYQKLKDLQRKEKYNDCLLVRCMKKFGIKQPENELEKEIDSFMKHKKLRKLDLKNIRKKINNLIKQQKTPSNKVLKSTSDLFQNNNKNENAKQQLTEINNNNNNNYSTLSPRKTKLNPINTINPMFNGRYASTVSLPLRLGRIAKIVGLDEVMKMKDVVDVTVYYSEGHECVKQHLNTLDQLFARVMVVCGSEKELYERLSQIRNMVRVEDEFGANMIIWTTFDKTLDASVYGGGQFRLNKCLNHWQ